MKEIGLDWLVVDSAAGTRGDALRDAMRRADAMVVPVSPSSFDMAATAQFLEAIGEYKSVREKGVPVGLVAMRVDTRTRAAGELDEFLAAMTSRWSRTCATRRCTSTARATAIPCSTFRARAASRTGTSGNLDAVACPSVEGVEQPVAVAGPVGRRQGSIDAAKRRAEATENRGREPTMLQRGTWRVAVGAAVPPLTLGKHLRGASLAGAGTGDPAPTNRSRQSNQREIVGLRPRFLPDQPLRQAPASIDFQHGVAPSGLRPHHSKTTSWPLPSLPRRPWRRHPWLHRRLRRCVARGGRGVLGGGGRGGSRVLGRLLGLGGGVARARLGGFSGLDGGVLARLCGDFSLLLAASACSLALSLHAVKVKARATAERPAMMDLRIDVSPWMLIGDVGAPGCMVRLRADILLDLTDAAHQAAMRSRSTKGRMPPSL